MDRTSLRFSDSLFAQGYVDPTREAVARIPSRFSMMNEDEFSYRLLLFIVDPEECVKPTPANKTLNEGNPTHDKNQPIDPIVSVMWLPWT